MLSAMEFSLGALNLASVSIAEICTFISPISNIIHSMYFWATLQSVLDWIKGGDTNYPVNCTSTTVSADMIA